MIKIHKEAIDLMINHAIDTYPEECCGIVTGNEQNHTVHKCKNIQNRLHEEDPIVHPRDARTAYAIDRKEAEVIFLLTRDKGENVIGFYHSHTDHEAYFSLEDVEAQIVFGEPEFPEALHIVISIRDKRFHNIAIFKWDRTKKDFIASDSSLNPE